MCLGKKSTTLFELKHKYENKIEVIKQNDKPIDEIKKYLLFVHYHDQKGHYVIRSMRKRLKLLFPEMVATSITFTKTKLGSCFSIKYETNLNTSMI